MSLKTIAKSALLAVLAVALPGLAGCSMDDIQLNGKVFDAMGMNTTGSVKSGDPKMAVREPLVVPPGLDSLPPPGSGKDAQPTLAEIQEIQRRLTALGYDTGGADGRVGRDTMRAAQAFQKRVGMDPADGYPGLALLARLRQGA